MGTTDVLWARLRPPVIPGFAIARPDLTARVAEGADVGAVTVTAPAGFGKTTLVAQFLAEQELPWVWCSCDERLDPTALLAHLTAGIAERFEGFGAGLGRPPLLDEQVLGFSNELAKVVPEPMLLVLDDVHRLPEGSLRAKSKGRMGIDWMVFEGGVGTLDVRPAFETHDGAVGLVQYGGKVDMRGHPDSVGPVYATPRFEIADPRYEWLNFIQAVGKGEVDEDLVIRYEWFELK